jgi:hypothetical protein
MNINLFKRLLELNTLWPSPVTDVVETTNALAASLGIGGTSGGLTPEVTIALCNVLNDILPFAERNDNAGRTSDGRDEGAPRSQGGRQAWRAYDRRKVRAQSGGYLPDAVHRPRRRWIYRPRQNGQGDDGR